MRHSMIFRLRNYKIGEVRASGEIYLYVVLATNLLLVRRAKRSHHPRLPYIANVGFHRTHPLLSIDTPLN